MDYASSDSDLDEDAADQPELDAHMTPTMILSVMDVASRDESNVLALVDAGCILAISTLARHAVRPEHRSTFLYVDGDSSTMKLMLKVLRNLSNHWHLHFYHATIRPLFTTRDIRTLVNLLKMLMAPTVTAQHEVRDCVTLAVDTLHRLASISRYAADIVNARGVVALSDVVLCALHLIDDDTRELAADTLSLLMTASNHPTQARADFVISELVHNSLVVDVGDLLFGPSGPRVAPAVQVLSVACQSVRDDGDASAITLQAGRVMLHYLANGANASLQTRVAEALYHLSTIGTNVEIFELIDAPDSLVASLRDSRDGRLVFATKTLANALPYWLVDEQLLDQLQESTVVSTLVGLLQSSRFRFGLVEQSVMISVRVMVTHNERLSRV